MSSRDCGSPTMGHGAGRTPISTCLHHDPVAHLNDKVEIIHGISYSNRKHFRLHTIDRRGKPKEQFLQKDPAWEKVETQLKAHLEHRAKRYADREQASFKHSATVKRMAERVHRSAMDLEGTSASKITPGQGAQQKETEKQADKTETSKPRTTETLRTKQERKSSKQEDTATLDQAATVDGPTLSGDVAS